VQHEHQRRPWLLDRGHEQELAPDLELEDERVPAIEFHDEVLGPPPGTRDTNAFQPADELFGRGLLHK
jgi:hypothetical protein